MAVVLYDPVQPDMLVLSNGGDHMSETYTIQVGNRIIRVNKKTGRHVVIKKLPLRKGTWTNDGKGWHFQEDRTRRK
jgi:hypothetical protein